MRAQKKRRVSWRSHRRLRQVLLAFGSAGIVLGFVLLVLYVHRREDVLLWLGLVYVIGAGILVGIRAILGHLDDLHRRRRYQAVERGASSA